MRRILQVGRPKALTYEPKELIGKGKAIFPHISLDLNLFKILKGCNSVLMD